MPMVRIASLLAVQLVQLIMFPVWLHGYPDSSIQAASNNSLQHQGQAGQGQRIRCQFRLPQPEWFKRRTLAANIPEPVPRESGRSSCKLRALAKVQVDSIWVNDLTILMRSSFTVLNS